MATTTGKAHCVTCEKEKTIYKCGGCSQDFCFNCLLNHRQLLEKQLDEIENERNLFRQTLTEQINNPLKHSLVQQIDKWKQESINKIEETAEKAKKLLVRHTSGHIKEIEIKLTKLTEQVEQIRRDNDINEIILNQFKQKLTQLKEELVNPLNISIQEDPSPFINKISVITFSEQLYIPNITANAKWTQNGIILAGEKGRGNGLNQLNRPWGLYVDDDQTLYIADCANHRIVEWKYGATSGRVVAGGNGSGNQNNQLTNPRDVIVDKTNDCLIISDQGNKRIVRWPRQNSKNGETIISNVNSYGLTMDNYGYLYVSDYEKHEVKRWKIGDADGNVVAGGNGSGSRLDQLNCPSYIFVDQDYSVYVSDFSNHRIMKWIKDAKAGLVVAGGQGQGNSLTQLSNPYGVIVDQLDTVYVADCSNNRIIRWPKGATQGNVICGGNVSNEEANQLKGPVGLSFDRQNNLYIAANGNHRVQKFNIE